MKLAKNIKKEFLAKTFLYNVIFYQIFLLFKFLKISYVLLKYQRIVRRSTRLCNFTIIHLHGTEGNFCCEFCLSRFLFTTTG